MASIRKFWGRFQLRLIIIYFHLLQSISPKYAAAKAYALMSAPRAFKLKEMERQTLEKATVSDFRFENFLTKRYLWESQERVDGGGAGEGKRVLLIHGWEGNAGNFGALVKMLTAEGCTVIAYDAPAHGQSSRAPVSMFKFGHFVTATLPDADPDYIITHSFGGVALVHALIQSPQVTIDKVVMITTPDRFEDRVNQFFDLFGFSPETRAQIYALAKAETGQEITELSVSRRCRDTHVTEALIIHDRDDKVIPIAWSRRVADAWPVAKLIEVEGTGHYRILWDQQTAQIIQKFLFS